MNIFQAIKMQCSLMFHKYSFKFVFSLMMIYSLGVYLINLYTSSGKDVSTLHSAVSLYVGSSIGEYFHYFSSIFPFIVVFPFAFSYLNDKSVNIIPFVMTRMGSNYYYSSKLIAAFIGGVLIILIPFAINLLLLTITFPHNDNTYFGFFHDINYGSRLLGTNVIVSSAGKGLPFLQLYMTSPLLHSCLYLVFLSLFSGLLSIFALACSYWISKYKVLVFIPVYLLFFMCNTLDNFLFKSQNYLNTILLDYVTVDVSPGKHALFFIPFCFVILFFSLYRSWQVSLKDQI